MQDAIIRSKSVVYVTELSQQWVAFIIDALCIESNKCIEM